jgi:hypothetical protein
LVATTRANRKAPTAKGALKAAGSKTYGVTNSNRIRGRTTQGERAKDREALATKEADCKSGTRAGTADGFCLSARYEQMDPEEKASVSQLWQAYMLIRQQREAQQAAAAQTASGEPGTSSSSGQPIGAETSGDNLTQGPEQLSQTAESEVAACGGPVGSRVTIIVP